jgi:hypothetical protein
LRYRRIRVAEDDARALLRLARFAIRIEQARTKGGLYPADARDLQPPVDPLAWPHLVRYEAILGGRGYKVWSVGIDGKDDGGDPQSGKDAVLERKPR